MENMSKSALIYLRWMQGAISEAQRDDYLRDWYAFKRLLGVTESYEEMVRAARGEAIIYAKAGGQP